MFNFEFDGGFPRNLGTSFKTRTQQFRAPIDTPRVSNARKLAARGTFEQRPVNRVFPRQLGYWRTFIDLLSKLLREVPVVPFDETGRINANTHTVAFSAL